MKEAEKLAMAWNKMPGEKSWTWYPSYQCIFLCEYYLKTGDKRVLKTIKGLAERLYLAQVVDPSLYKDRMHGGKPQAKNYLKGGLGHGARIPPATSSTSARTPGTVRRRTAPEAGQRPRGD